MTYANVLLDLLIRAGKREALLRKSGLDELVLEKIYKLPSPIKERAFVRYLLLTRLSD